MSIFGMELRYNQGMSASNIEVDEKSQGGEGDRGHWGGSEEEFLERNMGTFKFRGGQRYILQGDGTMALSQGTRVSNGTPSRNEESPRRKRCPTRSSRGQ